MMRTRAKAETESLTECGEQLTPNCRTRDREYGAQSDYDPAQAMNPTGLRNDPWVSEPLRVDVLVKRRPVRRLCGAVFVHNGVIAW